MLSSSVFTVQQASFIAACSLAKVWKVCIHKVSESIHRRNLSASYAMLLP